MITLTDLDAIEAEVARIDEPGLRKICAFCRADLLGSDRLGARTSHGACSPLCDEAKAMGWIDAFRDGTKPGMDAHST